LGSKRVYHFFEAPYLGQLLVLMGELLAAFFFLFDARVVYFEQAHKG
tara:strand:- start:175 stop:315 length:141 start_codon:yes stop_codon:yes gene_type:complete